MRQRLQHAVWGSKVRPTSTLTSLKDVGVVFRVYNQPYGGGVAELGVSNLRALGHQRVSTHSAAPSSTLALALYPPSLITSPSRVNACRTVSHECCNPKGHT